MRSLGIWSLKGNLNWDFIKNSEGNLTVFGYYLSAGFAPIHTDYCFVGFYGTMGGCKIDNYSYSGPGISGTAIFNITDRLGVLINCDITKWYAEYEGDEEIPPFLPRYSDTIRICTSIGISYMLY